MKKLMIAIMIIIIRTSFSLFIIIKVSRIFHFGKNPSNGGMPPNLKSKIDRVGVFNLFMWILNELKFLKNRMIETKIIQ
jgi:hypothetical protein